MTQMIGPDRLGLAAAPAPRRRTATRRIAALVALLLVGAAATAGVVWLRGALDRLTLVPGCSATALGNTTSLDPEQTGNAATIASVAVRRGLPARAATIGIATAMQESKLRNLSYGDRDSLGLFQQRPSQGWGTAEQIRDPVYASNAFYDVLVKIEGYQNLPITKAAQKVQRSAFPSAYAAHEPEARILASALAGHSEAALTCALRAPRGGAERVGADGLTPRAKAVLTAADAETGRTGAAPAGEATGTSVEFRLTGTEADRLGWSLAHWAVARAEALDVVEVRVDGRRWLRSAPRDGWTSLGTGPAAGAVGAGTVVVRVAGA